MPRVFVSYARQDLPLVEQLATHLASTPGLSSWCDQEKIYGGQHWPKVLGEAIADQDVFLLAWSKAAADSYYVEFEWTTAIALKKTIVLCLLDDTPLAPALKALHAHRASDIEGLVHSLRTAAPGDTNRRAPVIHALGGITATEPGPVLAQAKSVFAHQLWSVQGNVYQDYWKASDIYNHRGCPPPPADSVPYLGLRPKWWQLWKRRSRYPPSDSRIDPSDAGPVLLGGSSPKKVRQGQSFTARFIAYRPDLEKKVRRMLATLCPDSSSHFGLKICRWKRGTEVVVLLSGQFLEVQQPRQTFTWEGGNSLVDFDVTVAQHAPLGTTTLRYDVSIHDVIVATLRLDIKISRVQVSAEQRLQRYIPHKPPLHPMPYRTGNECWTESLR